MLIYAIQNSANDPRFTIVSILLMIPALLLSLTIHEYSHGRMALAIGDKTALMAGRLTLNPLRHLDPIGALMLFLFGFGYAKPVPINTRNFEKVKYKTGMILVAIAGPLSNFLLALIGMLGLHVTNTIASGIESETFLNIQLSDTLYFTIFSDKMPIILTCMFFLYLITMNIGLGIFNLIPLPPLDGSRILTVFLPVKAQMWFFKYERYIQLAIFALLWFGVLDTPLSALRDLIFSGMDKLISLIPFLM